MNNISRFRIGHYISNEIFDIDNYIIIIVRTYNIRYLSCKFNNHVARLKQNNTYYKTNFMKIISLSEKILHQSLPVKIQLLVNHIIN